MSRPPCDFLAPFAVANRLIPFGGMGRESDSVGGEWMSEEEIDYNLMGSFPASDPPSWTLGVRPRKTSREEFEGEKPSPHDPSHQNEPPE